MDSKGQVSVEYLLVFLVVIIILSTITIPLISNSLTSSNDVSIASDASIAVNSFADAAEVVYANGPMAKRTITVYIPLNTNLTTGNTTIKLNVLYSTGNDTVDANISYPIQNKTTSLTRGWHTINVTWLLGTNYISYNIN